VKELEIIGTDPRVEPELKLLSVLALVDA